MVRRRGDGPVDCGREGRTLGFLGRGVGAEEGEEGWSGGGVGEVSGSEGGEGGHRVG